MTLHVCHKGTFASVKLVSALYVLKQLPPAPPTLLKIYAGSEAARDKDTGRPDSRVEQRAERPSIK